MQPIQDNTRVLNDKLIDRITTLFKIERNVARWIVTDFGYDVPIATVIQVLDNIPLYLFLRENSIVYCTSIASALARATQEQVILSLEDIKIYAIVNYTSYDAVYEQLCEHYTEHNHELPISDVYQIVGVNMQQRLVFFSSASAAGDVKREIVKLGLKCVSSTAGENCQIYRLENVCANRAETTELYNKITNSIDRPMPHIAREIHDRYSDMGLDANIAGMLVDVLGAEMVIENRIGHRFIMFKGDWRTYSKELITDIITKTIGISVESEFQWKFVEYDIPAIVNDGNGNIEIVDRRVAFCCITGTDIRADQKSSREIEIAPVVAVLPTFNIMSKSEKMAKWVSKNPPLDGELKEDYKKRVAMSFPIVDNVAFGHSLKQAGFVRYKKPYINGMQKRQFVIGDH